MSIESEKDILELKDKIGDLSGQELKTQCLLNNIRAEKVNALAELDYLINKNHISNIVMKVFKKPEGSGHA